MYTELYCNLYSSIGFIAKTHLSSRPLTEICFESRLFAVTVQTSLREYGKLILTLVFLGRKFINKSPIFPGKNLEIPDGSAIFHIKPGGFTDF